MLLMSASTSSESLPLRLDFMRIASCRSYSLDCLLRSSICSYAHEHQLPGDKLNSLPLSMVDHLSDTLRGPFEAIRSMTKLPRISMLLP